MTQPVARIVANIAVGAAAVAVAYVVVRNPRRRAVAWRLAKTSTTTVLPAYLMREVQQAWADSAVTGPRDSDGHV